MRVLPPSSQILPLLALVGANALWGASAVASKPVVAHVPPLTAACLRVAIALIVLLPLVARTGGRPARGRAPALLGLTGVALFCLCQNVGLRYASAATTALLNGGIPILTAILAARLLGERLGGRGVAGVLVSGGGVAAIVLLGPGATFGAATLGSLLPLAGAVSFAAYTVLGRRTFAVGHTVAIVAGSTRYGLLFLLPGAGLELTTGELGPLTLSDVLLLLYLGVGCSALAFVLCGYGLARLEATQGAVCGNLKPLVGVGLAMGLLGESLTPGQLGWRLAGPPRRRPGKWKNGPPKSRGRIKWRADGEAGPGRRRPDPTPTNWSAASGAARRGPSIGAADESCFLCHLRPDGITACHEISSLQGVTPLGGRLDRRDPNVRAAAASCPLVFARRCASRAERADQRRQMGDGRPTLPVFFLDVAGASRQAVLTASAMAWPHRTRPR